MIKLKFNRRALCMGDDVNNGVYMIKMPDDATLGNLMEVLLHGGNGNDWPVPQTSEIGWVIYSNIGIIADVSADKKHIKYFDKDEDTQLSALDLRWVFGEREGTIPDINSLWRLFRD